MSMRRHSIVALFSLIVTLRLAAPLAAQERPLASDALRRALANGTFEQVLQTMLRPLIQGSGDPAVTFDDDGLRALGREQLASGNTQNALYVLEVNAFANAESHAAAVAAADAYHEAGLEGPARQQYERALQLDPGDEHVQARLEQLGPPGGEMAMGGALPSKEEVERIKRMAESMPPEQRKQMLERIEQFEAARGGGAEGQMAVRARLEKIATMEMQGDAPAGMAEADMESRAQVMERLRGKQPISRALREKVRAGDAQGAVAEYRRLQREQPDRYEFADEHLAEFSPVHPRERGSRRYFAEDWTAALPLLELRVEEYPRSADAHADLGVVSFLNGQREHALARLARARELDAEAPGAALALLKERHWCAYHELGTASGEVERTLSPETLTAVFGEYAKADDRERDRTYFVTSPVELYGSEGADCDGTGEELYQGAMWGDAQNYILTHVSGTTFRKQYGGYDRNTGEWGTVEEWRFVLSDGRVEQLIVTDVETGESTAYVRVGPDPF